VVAVSALLVIEPTKVIGMFVSVFLFGMAAGLAVYHFFYTRR
jgi:hypothetical protein